MRHARAVLLTVLTAAIAACTPIYEQREEALEMFARGRREAAFAALSALIEEAGFDHRDYPLLLLERGMMALAMGRYEQADDDLREADDRFVTLDYTHDPIGEIGKHLYSEDATLYKGAPYEKVAVQSMRALAALASGHAERAAVAARKGDQTARLYVLDQRHPGIAHPLVWHLFGLAYEGAAEWDNARILFDQAAQASPGPPFVDDFCRLARRSQAVELLQGRGLADYRPAGAPGQGHLVVVLLTGWSPHRVPYAKELEEQALSELNVEEAQRAKLLGEKVPFATMVPRAAPFDRATLDDEVGSALSGVAAADYEAQGMTWWQEHEWKVYLAAGSRWLARYFAGEVSRALVEDSSDSSTLGDAASRLTQWALAKLDHPDTRSWRMLPRHVLIAERWAAPGPWRGRLRLSGPQAERMIEITADLVADRATVVPVVVYE